MKITGSLEVLSQYTCEYFDAQYEYDYLNVSEYEYEYWRKVLY